MSGGHVRSGTALSLVLATLLGWSTACRDGVGPTAVRPSHDSLPGLIVSGPVAPKGAASVRGPAPSSPAGASVVYVSLPPGSVPTGVQATIRDLVTRQSVTTAVLNGGFDPVGLAATVGDTLTVDIARSGSGGPIHGWELVKAYRPPVVVRTDPPPHKVDVPLNSIMVIVFSEPIDSATLNTGSVELWRDTTPVPGTVRFSDATGLRAEFDPSSLLSTQTVYRLVVSQAIRDVNGTALEAPVDLGFTTGGTVQTAARLTFLVQPSTVAAGGMIRPAVVVAIQDTPGNTVTSATSAVTVALGANPAAGTLSGTMTVNAVGGLATFWDLSIDKIGAGYTLTASSGTLTSATSAVFAVGAAILVDASRDGGVWWFPQAGQGGFNPALDHQGKALADSLRAMGYHVDELGRPSYITAEVLQRYDIVIRAGVYGGYQPDEITAYQNYVRGGGKLLLLADHMAQAAGPADSLGLSFGLAFAGISRGENLLEVTAGHPITNGVGTLAYGVGSGLVSAPPSAQILGTLSAGSYLDLNNNGQQDPNEPSAPPVLGVMTYGTGRIVFCGDTNLWEWIPQPLLSNVLAWLKGP